MPQPMNMTDAAQDLVIRAREGDQNAMAIIALVGKNAREEKHAIKARIAYECIKSAIKQSDIGEEAPEVSKSLLSGLLSPESFIPCFSQLWRCKDGMCAIVVMLANGPAFNIERLTQYAEAAQAGEDDSGKAKVAIELAHAIQRVRKGAPIRNVSREASWELGER